MKKRILFVTPYPMGEAGSQRFRFEMFYPTLEKNGYTLVSKPFFSPAVWKILYRPGKVLQKVTGTLGGFLRRILLLFSLPKYDWVFIHREATPLGPPFFEWCAAKVFGKRIIYDFDDAIWKRDFSEANRLAGWLKQPGKVARICRWSYRVSAGNAYLAKFAEAYNERVDIVPTIVDTERGHHRMQDQNTANPAIGWTGTHTTLKYLSPLLPVLEKLQKEHPFTLYVICNQAPDWTADWLHYIPWSKSTEMEDLLHFHIGLMPLEDDEWANGKCGFKAIQYMALGIPAVASAVGMNSILIEQGKSGFLVESDADWERYLRILLLEKDLRTSMGIASRKKIEQDYSATGTIPKFLALFT